MQARQDHCAEISACQRAYVPAAIVTVDIRARRGDAIRGTGHRRSVIWSQVQRLQRVGLFHRR